MKENKSNVALTQVTEWSDGELRRTDDFLATEEPLEIRIGRRSLGIALRTPGNDRELVAGLLFTEGLINSIGDVSQIEVADPDETGDAFPKRASMSKRNMARVTLRRGTKVGDSSKSARRGFFAGSACGACGKASIDVLRARGVRRPNEALRIDPETLCGLPEKLRTSQAVFGRTGGLHAAALFDTGGELVVAREDIGRHNAVDKAIGWALLQDCASLGDYAMLVSGRGGFEIVQKAIVAGIPVLASVSAPSSLAVQMAREMGLTLIGFLRGRRFVVYAHEERLQPAVATR